MEIRIEVQKAFSWGKEDALNGCDQAPSVYFLPDSSQWHAYNTGYRTGCIVTGQQDRCWVPFQGNYSDVLPAEQREDYVGA